jgi:YHS domain-containing protein
MPQPSSSHSLRSAAGIAALSIAIALGGCTAMQSQNPSGALAPVNAVAGPAGEKLMLKGFDVVAYHTQGKHAMGSASHSSVHEGVSFWFASADHKALFDKTPAKYIPEYGGYCANGIVYGIPWGGDGDTWAMINGKVYIFGGQMSKDGFMLDPATNLKLAEQYWKSEVQGSNSFLQRAKRLVLRVPHYKSGSELSQAIAASKAKGN